MNKSLRAVLVKSCTHGVDPLSLLALLKWLVSKDIQQALTNVSRCLFFFLLGGIQWYTLVSSALPCQMPFCQTAPLQPSVTWQQNLMGYCWDGSTSAAVTPTSTSDVMGQHNEIGGITFRAALALRHLPPLETGTLISKMKQDLIITRVRIFLLCYGLIT